MKSACPSREYVQTTLEDSTDSTERRDVVLHLAECAGCRDAYVAWRPRGKRWRLALAALALIAIVAGGVVWFRTRANPMRQIVMAARSLVWRPVQARLSADFAYRPYRGSVRGDSNGRLLPTGDLGNDEHAVALASLLAGETDHAVLILERLAHADPRRADLLGDLAAAKFERSVRKESPGDAAAAFASAAQALQLEPRDLQALQIRALALESLFLRDDAKESWSEYLRADSSSPWAVEAREHLDRLSASSEDAEKSLDRAIASNDRVLLEQTVARWPQNARTRVEETFLGEWANAIANGDSAKAELALTHAEAIAKAIAAHSGERMGLDAVMAIRRAPAAADFAAAHRAYTAARQANAVARNVTARDALLTAGRLLDGARSPLAPRAWIAAATIDHYIGQSDEARRLLNDGLAKLAGHERDDPVAIGESLWMLGLIDQGQGRSGDALRNYHAAQPFLERSGEAASVAGISTVLSETYRYLGDLETAWKYNAAALRWADASGVYRRRQGTLNDAALLAMESAQPQLAMLLARRMASNAAKSKDRVNSALAALTEGRAFMQVDRAGEARQQFDRAVAILNAAPLDGSTLRLYADVAIARGDLLTRTEPAAAVAFLSDASRRLAELHSQSRLARLHLLSGRAYRAVGDRANEKRELLAGIAQLSSQREHLDDDQERSTFTDTGRALFDETIELLIAGGEDEEALRVVRMARTIGVTTPGALASDDLSMGSTVPAGTVFIEYYILEDELLVWSTSGTVSRLTRKPTPGARWHSIGADVAKIAGCRADADCADITADLYDLLLRPVANELAGKREIFIAPDGVLHLVPFGALYDRNGHQYLTASHVITVVLSPTPPMPASSGYRSILIAAATDASSDLPGLPGAAIEAKDAARFFSKSELLTGAAATADQFLAKSGEFDVVHFAGHAIWNERSPRHAALRFARDAGHPAGDLHPNELREHPPGRTRLAVLAACDTARGRLTSAGPLSFARAYSAIGVSHVIGSLWPVDDAVSEAFFLSFYEALTRGESPAEALNAAQRRGIESRVRGPGTWATFELYAGASGSGLR